MVHNSTNISLFELQSHDAYPSFSCYNPTYNIQQTDTNFRNAGVHVKPERANAVFFSYIDPDTLTMDTGFTEHSGCPVYEGTKRIVTQWIRLGVDDENPWDSFNTLGVKLSELDEDGNAANEGDESDEEDGEDDANDYEDEEDGEL
jgi:hypothetical protein